MKIIILDDSLTVRMIIESYLEDLGVEDDEVFSFDDGYKALEFIKIEGVDIVFSDINMPLMSGFEFAKSAFNLLPTLKKTFFAISGDETKESYTKMKESGVHHFLKKPINNLHFNHFVLPLILRQRHIDSL